MPIIELVTAATSKAATAAVTPLLRDLLDVQDQQARALEALHADVRSMLEGPWRRARTALEDAVDAGGPRRRELLDAVAAALREAHSYEKEPSATRAAAAAEMAAVSTLLRHPDEACRWAQRAHDDALATIKREIPRLAATLRVKGNLAQRFRDFNRPYTEPDRYGFWDKLVKPGNYPTVDRAVYRQVFVRAFTEGIEVPRDEAAAAVLFGFPSSTARDALRSVHYAQRYTVPGIRLMALHRLAADTEDFRRVRAHLCGGPPLPAQRLRVDVSVPYRPELEWIAA
jgi:hypothetical protein